MTGIDTYKKKGKNWVQLTRPKSANLRAGGYDCVEKKRRGRDVASKK